MLKTGDRAPDFSLPDETGRLRSEADLKGRWALIYFYPKDMTPGCVKEACAIREVFPDFKKLKAIVMGVSTDSIESHKKFSAAHRLTFPLLADTTKEMVRAYGVWGKKKFMGREYEGTKRTSFLIDPQGKIVKIYEAVKPAEHAREVLADLGALGA